MHSLVYATLPGTESMLLMVSLLWKSAQFPFSTLLELLCDCAFAGIKEDVVGRTRTLSKCVVIETSAYLCTDFVVNTARLDQLQTQAPSKLICIWIVTFASWSHGHLTCPPLIRPFILVAPSNHIWKLSFVCQSFAAAHHNACVPFEPMDSIVSPWTR